jgi:hypothetical protein
VALPLLREADNVLAMRVSREFRASNLASIKKHPLLPPHLPLWITGVTDMTMQAIFATDNMTGMTGMTMQTIFAPDK